MPESDPDQLAEELAELQKQHPDLNMDEFVANVTKLAKGFLEEQTNKPFGIQAIIFLAFLLIPISLILFCFCKIINSQKKREGKKKEKKENKKHTKKKA